MIDRRPAEAYLHPGPTMVLAYEFGAWLVANHLDVEVVLRTAAVHPHPQILQSALTLKSAAEQWDRWDGAAASASGSSARKLFAVQAEAPPPLDEMSTAQAATVLGISSRAVRLACEQGRLPARVVDGRRRIARQDLDSYRPRRA
ncbi:MAG: helix-turn-helix domain-containing protein [Actinomycetota bacterium]|nr:helix-turn-helix domain-containing protein [Actinomycetota bacterium]